MSKIIKFAGVVFLQLVGTQVVTFIASFLFPLMNTPEQFNSWMLALLLTTTFTLGVFLVGWLGFRLGWLNPPTHLQMRLVCTLIGAFLLMAIGILFFNVLEAGSPFFGMSILASILGFHLPTWLKK
ncbi:MAG: hypothetical protein A2X25_10275 [Chloroflexi bacterium GWB2_49_20]|nr:MAG: hypothetical protein A2X25_10275 [Chloroflexi bacterium GWB2_49_20]OGN79197.1 MAG: hypothetical protein A2X26_03745 [Chloroflexi bacterium GWC2_49_37]OGN83033.1 MAG: hypothetical protein A2X27_08950 [Chloroflexi bacterium GWD2_49_16]HCC78694.1 hypothetical protein [Anaerolineae bacterium]